MKPYLLFAGSNYYPSGGITDLVDDYATLNDAIVAARVLLLDRHEWAHVWTSARPDDVYEMYVHAKGEWNEPELQNTGEPKKRTWVSMRTVVEKWASRC